MSQVYFWEDDYCSIELLPVENYEFCVEQAKRITEFAKAHGAGKGYTDVIAREENPIPLRNKSIPKTSLEDVLSGLLTRYEKVLYYSGSSFVEDTCTRSYGFDDLVIVFFEDRDGIISNIWLNLDTRTEESQTKANDVLFALSELEDLLIADWGWCFISKLSDQTSIKQYLEKRFEVFAANKVTLSSGEQTT